MCSHQVSDNASNLEPTFVKSGFFKINFLNSYLVFDEKLNVAVEGMKKYEFKGKQFHEECFCCKVCRQPIGVKTFIPRDQEAVCVPCYEEQYAQRCVQCNGVSTNKYTVLINNFVIREFLPRCVQCRCGLAMRILSLRLSVRSSIKRVICNKMEERSTQIFISYERPFSLVF